MAADQISLPADYPQIDRCFTPWIRRTALSIARAVAFPLLILPLVTALVASADEKASGEDELRPSYPRTEMLEHAALEADIRTRNGFELAGRQAPFAARAEFIGALRLVAQGLDAQDRSQRHGRALRDALLAIREADDFVPRGNKIEADLDLPALISGHSTPVLKDTPPGELTSTHCVRCYLSFAQQKLSEAVEQETAGAMALYGLGKLHAAWARTQAPSLVAGDAKAVVFLQAALMVQPEHALAANELGVVFARAGRWHDARPWIELSAALQPDATRLRNLAAVYRQLGLEREMQSVLRLAALRQADAARADDSSQPVVWLDPRSFAEPAARTAAAETHTSNIAVSNAAIPRSPTNQTPGSPSQPKTLIAPPSPPPSVEGSRPALLDSMRSATRPASNATPPPKPSLFPATGPQGPKNAPAVVPMPPAPAPSWRALGATLEPQPGPAGGSANRAPVAVEAPRADDLPFANDAMRAEHCLFPAPLALTTGEALPSLDGRRLSSVTPAVGTTRECDGTAQALGEVQPALSSEAFATDRRERIMRRLRSYSPEHMSQILLCQALGPAAPCDICAVDCSCCNGRCRGWCWERARRAQWQAYAQGEYVGAARLEHVSEYRLRVDDQLDMIYRVTREENSQPYKLNVGDEISVESFTDPELNRNLIIQPDGTVTLRLLGQVKATGQTVPQLRDVIEEKYKQYYKSPAITVTPLRVNTKLEDLRATVDRRQGVGGQSQLVRITPEGTISLPAIGSIRAQGLTLRELQVELNERYRQEVEGIEVVPVLAQRAPRYIYVLGEVRTPGRFELTGPTTAIQAIAMAGSWNVGAHLRQVVVFRRGEDWRLLATMINLEQALCGNQPCPAGEIWLADSDVVIVPKSPILKAADFIDLVFTRGIYGVFPLSANINFIKASSI